MHCRNRLCIIELRGIDSGLNWLSAKTEQRYGLTSLSRRHVPVEFQTVMFDSLHQLTRQCVKAGMTFIKRSYWWHDIGCDVSKWTKACEACQKAKVYVHPKSLLERLPAPKKRFSHIHIDLVGPLNPACEGKNVLLTVIGRWTGWPDAFPMTMHGDAANAKACAKVVGLQCGAFQTLSLQIEDHSSFLICGSKCVS